MHSKLSFVMAGHRRPKDSVASLAYVPAIPTPAALHCPVNRDHRDSALRAGPVMTG